MNRNHRPEADPLDASLGRSNPVKRSSLATDGIERALDAIGASIIDRSRDAMPQPRRRRSVGRRAVLVAAALVAATATLAAGAVLTAHTGFFQPTRAEIRSASPPDAARMRSELAMGGPGEFLDPSAPDYRTVALQVSSDIPYPQGYVSWRDFLISQEIRYADGGTESSGALHGWFAASAFCSWVQVWRQADISGDTQAASHAAGVISDAPGWSAVTDEDPHPDPSVRGDAGSMTYSLFGWMLPYSDAVLAGDRGRVDHLLARGYGDKCWTSDPEWMSLIAAHPGWRGFSKAEMADEYEKFLTSERS